MLSRGLLEEDVTRYGALPRTKQERPVLAGILNDYACVQFPEYAKSYSGAGVVGVPGFWQELSGVVRIWKRRNYVMPLLVIPYKDENGFIQACQIRLHVNDISSDEKRYCWLSSPQERRGTSSGTPIHFTFLKEKLPPGETVLITEGVEWQLETYGAAIQLNQPRLIIDWLPLVKTRFAYRLQDRLLDS